jgi:NAD(P)-dependent dehydrogenase (short-subunit alcohol dehydrogenase family)
VKADVSSESDVQALVQKAISTYGRLDCAFNNAGIDLAVKPLHEQSIEDFDKIMSINARGLFLCVNYPTHKGMGLVIQFPISGQTTIG